MENSYFHFAVKIEINRLRSAKLSEKESLAGHPKPEAPRLDAMSAHFISHSKKSLNSEYHSKPWHMISFPSLKDSHIKKKTNNQTTSDVLLLQSGKTVQTSQVFLQPDISGIGTRGALDCSDSEPMEIC